MIKHNGFFFKANKSIYSKQTGEKVELSEKVLEQRPREVSPAGLQPREGTRPWRVPRETITTASVGLAVWGAVERTSLNSRLLRSTGRSLQGGDMRASHEGLTCRVSMVPVLLGQPWFSHSKSHVLIPDKLA